MGNRCNRREMHRVCMNASDDGLRVVDLIDRVIDLLIV